MSGSYRKHGSKWQYTLDCGYQPRRRCRDCNTPYWVERKSPSVCSRCGGELAPPVEERRQIAKGGFRTKKEAELAHDKAKNDLRNNIYVTPCKLTMAEFLENEWLPSAERTVRPSTFQGYKGLVRRYVIPELGKLRLDRLTAGTINAFYDRLLTNGRTKGRSEEAADEPDQFGLAPATVCRVHAVLHRSLKDAVRWGYLQNNPAAGADKPREATGRRAPATWTGAQVDTYLASVREDRLFAMWRLFLTTGMRRGEVLGLQWGDLDLDEGWCSISRTRTPGVGGKVIVGEPKSANSRRCIGLDPATVEALKAYRRPLLEKAIRSGATWDPEAWVFTTERGAPLDPNKVSRMFRSASERAGLPVIRLHDTRHTAASLGLLGTKDFKLISATLGHSNVAFTLSTYAHIIPASQKALAGVIADQIRPDEEGDVVRMLSNEQ